MSPWLPLGVEGPLRPADPLPLPAQALKRGMRARLRPAMAAGAKAALQLLYPPSCLACRAATRESGVLCTPCWTAVRFIERPFCERLGTPFAQDLGPGLLSPEVMADPPVWARARAVAVFEDGPVKRLTYRLKYYDRMEVAKPLGRWMARAGLDLLQEADLLIPVPLHRGRLFARRFNQAMALAQSISQACGVPADGLVLERMRRTAPQVGLSRLQRAANMQGVFQVAPDKRLTIEGRRLVLIDDVLTSGATSNAAARVLLRAGAAQVDLLTFARVVVGDGAL